MFKAKIYTQKRLACPGRVKQRQEESDSQADVLTAILPAPLKAEVCVLHEINSSSVTYCHAT